MSDDRRLLHGVMAEFATSAELLRAVRTARAAGFRKMDAYSPYPIEGLAESLGFRFSWLPLVILIGATLGMLGGFALQYWCAAVDYPVPVAGKPLNSWPMFIPITFELTVLAGATTSVIALLIANGLPMPYHPVFHGARFDRASTDRFFLCIEAIDPKFDAEVCASFLAELAPLGIEEMPT